MNAKLFCFFVVLGFTILGQASSQLQEQSQQIQATPVSAGGSGGAVASANAATDVTGTSIISGDGVAGTAGTGTSFAGAGANSLNQGLALAGADSATNINLQATAIGATPATVILVPVQQQPQPIYQPTCFPINWFSTKLKAIDVGASSAGDLYAVGNEGFLYAYDFVNNLWWKVDGDYELLNIVRVDTSHDGTPFVTTIEGSMYYLSCDNKWTKLPGCAKDVGIGKLGDVFKIGCDAREGGFGIYRLFCKNSCANCCGKGCNRHRRPVNVGPPEDAELLKNTKKCYWIKMSGSGVRIDVDPKGYPYVVKKSGEIWGFEGEKNEWFHLHTQTKATDLTLSNEGMVFFTGENKNIYRVVDHLGSTVQLCGDGHAISAGPYSQPFVVGGKHKVMTLSKRGFN